MRKLIAIAWKDIKVKFSTPMEWLFFIVLPIIFTLVLAASTGREDTRIRLVVADQARSPLSERLVSELRLAKGIRVELLPLERAQAEFSARRAPALLIIPSTLDGAALERGPVECELRRQPSNTSALAAERAVRRATGRFGRAALLARARVGAKDAEGGRDAYFERALSEALAGLDAAPPLATTARALTPDEVSYDPGASSSAGQLITWVFIPLIGVSSLFAAERRKGTLRRLLMSPTGRASFLLGTIAGQVAVALVQMLLLVLFGIFVMGLPWARAPGALAVMLIAAALSAAALGTMLGAFVKTEAQANGLSILLGMVMALLGGCWYPIDLFPAAVRTGMRVLPTTWAMQGLLDILVRGQGLSAVLPSAGALLGFSAVFFTIGIARFKWE